MGIIIHHEGNLIGTINSQRFKEQMLLEWKSEDLDPYLLICNTTVCIFKKNWVMFFSFYQKLFLPYYKMSFLDKSA